MTERTNPYACPLADPAAGQPCPHRFYPECFANAPAYVRATQHYSTCRRAYGGCEAPNLPEPA